MLNFVGIRTAIITGRRSKVVEIRARELGITDLYQKVFRKSEVYAGLLAKYDLSDKNVAFMGDDTVDIEIFKRAGVTAAPADAEDDVRGMADFVSSRNGGRGAVREFVELILKATGNREKVSGEYID
jgi:3-deoxy-D-manno-octulosonate 8-phosphate phosphatase (KDO 8-P phosphatase)